MMIKKKIRYKIRLNDISQDTYLCRLRFSKVLPTEGLFWATPYRHNRAKNLLRKLRRTNHPKAELVEVDMNE